MEKPDTPIPEPDGPDAAAQRQPTMADVARVAEVSTATVSYYLSGRSELLKRIGPDAQRRIKDAVRALGYVQNKLARHLRLQRTERICVLLPKLGIPFADKITRDIDAAARLRGYSIIVVTGDTVEIWRRVIREVEEGLADGLVGDADVLTEDELKELFGGTTRLTKPRLVLHPSAAPTSFSVVNYDRLDSLQQALELLRDTGRRRIAYVENSWRRANERAELVQEFAARLDSGIDLAAIVRGASGRDSAAAAARELMAMPVPPQAMLVESDFAAVSIIEELQRGGFRVPEDVAIIGCGNAEEGYFCHPRLTTFGPASLSMTEAADHLIDLIESRAEAQQRFVVPWILYRRESA